MKMKTLISALFAFVLVIGINSCDKGGPTDFDKDDFGFNEFVLAAETAEECVSYGDVENDMEILGAFDSKRGRGVDMRKRPDKNNYRSLGMILRQLELSDEQYGAVKISMMAYRDCVKEAMLGLREQAKEIMEGFRAERMAIWEQLKAGEITREEAMELMQALNMKAREAMMALDARKIACEAMKICRAEMFAEIRGTLDEKQLILFDEWVASLPEIDCDREKE